MAKAEILAPVGGQEQLLAAVRCGADAVYLGGKSFNARRNASNFGDRELPDAVRYCHERGVKLFVTVNTLLTDGEYPALEEAAEGIALAGADGVILQDMAAAQLFAGRYPHIRRVASTQTAVHNLEGAKFLQDCGFDSFVLARELSLGEMEKICAGVDMEAEAFVHGAHCMSLSGACYLSAMLGGRSGNRGLCAQPCRLDWKCGGSRYALSMKDMSLVRRIGDLSAAGVTTLKIEGRMKRPEYVAAAVSACRAARDGGEFDEDTLRAVFSRSGFSAGYLQGKPDRDMFGYRTREDVTGAEGVLQKLAGLYHKEMPLVPVDMRFSMTGEKTELSVTDGAHTCIVSGPAPERAMTRPLDREGAEKNLVKTGGTQYYVNEFDVDLQPGLMLPASALNALRREALEELNQNRGAVKPWKREEYAPIPVERYVKSGSALWARFYKAEQVTGAEHLARIILPTGEIDEEVIERYGAKLTGQLPAVLFPGDEPALEKRLMALKTQGLNSLWTDNIYGIRMGLRMGFAVYGGFGLNIMNTQALDFYELEGLSAVTVSFELGMEKIKALGGSLPRGIVAYGYLPLMRFRNCPVRAAVGCASCGGQGFLTDRKGIEFPVECGGKRYSTLLNSIPLHIAERDDPGDFRLLYFTRETRDECSEILRDFRNNWKMDGSRTGGLYWRELL